MEEKKEAKIKTIPSDACCLQHTILQQLVSQIASPYNFYSFLSPPAANISFSVIPAEAEPATRLSILPQSPKHFSIHARANYHTLMQSQWVAGAPLNARGLCLSCINHLHDWRSRFCVEGWRREKEKKKLQRVIWVSGKKLDIPSIHKFIIIITIYVFNIIIIF